jgi:hypothetical protein
MAAEKPKPAPAKAPPPNSITQGAMKAGVRTCAGRINQVTNFLVAGTNNAGYITDISKNNPNQRMTSVSMEIPLKDSSAYAAASFAPAQANYCEGIYETVVYWPQRCTEVAEKNFAAFKKAGALSKRVYMRDGGAVKVFFMPAGTGCVVIKKELIR